MTLAEKIARAMVEDEAGEKWDNLTIFGEEAYLRRAITVLEAMRSPTPVVRLAGFTDAAFRLPSQVLDSQDFEPGAVWRAMIEAAIEEAKQ